MGDIGAYGAFLDREGLSKCHLYMTYLFTLLIYYMLYLACNQFWTLMTFNGIFSNTINDAYFFYINIMELLSFLFVRTRSSIKYFPKYITIVNLMFLMYINSYMYSCQFESLAVLQNFSLYMFFFFVNRYEFEAVNEWNAFGSWTPSEQNPRCGYHHVLLSPQYSIGFDIFTLGIPLRF